MSEENTTPKKEELEFDECELCGKPADFYCECSICQEEEGGGRYLCKHCFG